VRKRFASPRFRRRLFWTGGALVLLGGIVGVMLAYPNTGKRHEVFSNAPPQTVSTPTSVPATRELRVTVLDATLRFVSTAVRRDHVDASWTLVDPSLKQGFTRREWAKGNIPVVPYPAASVAGWTIDWVYANDVALDVALLPRKGSQLHPKTFMVELKRHRPHGPWLVVSWVPKGVSESDIADTTSAQKALPPPPGLGGKWLLIPLLGLVLFVVVPLSTMAVRGWLRANRAERAYRRSLEADSN
jgi:hypothetical protein